MFPDRHRISRITLASVPAFPCPEHHLKGEMIEVDQIVIHGGEGIKYSPLFDGALLAVGASVKFGGSFRKCTGFFEFLATENDDP